MKATAATTTAAPSTTAAGPAEVSIDGVTVDHGMLTTFTVS